MALKVYTQRDPKQNRKPAVDAILATSHTALSYNTITIPEDALQLRWTWAHEVTLNSHATALQRGAQ